LTLEARRLPNLDSLEIAGHHDLAADCEPGIRAEGLVDRDATLSIDDDFHHARRQGSTFLLGGLATLHGRRDFLGQSSRVLGRHHGDALVLSEQQVAAGLETAPKGRRKRKSTLGIELSLVFSDEYLHCLPLCPSW
jgi:hypothetical protein